MNNISSKSQKRQRLISFILINTMQYPCRLKSNIYHSDKRGPPPFFHLDTNPVLGRVLIHSVDRTHVLVLPLELSWLLFLNILSFNFVPTRNNFLRSKRFRKSYVNLPDVVLSNQTSYTAFLLDLCCAVHCDHVPFLQLFVPNTSAFAYSIFVEYTCCSNVVNSKMGKQTKRCERVIHKYIKTNSSN